jgi:Protein of unknown function (DUF2786)
MDIQAIIDKVQKLRRLARSDNVNEAAAAAAAADRLIQEHGLAEAQLQAEGAKPAESVVEDESAFAKWHGQAPTWQRILVSGLITHYDCASYLTWKCDDLHLKPALVQQVIGRPSDIAMARYMWGWLSVEIERLAQLHKGNGRSWLDSFRRGAVSGVLGKLRDSKAAVRGEATARAKVAAAINPDLAGSASSALAVYDRRSAEARDQLHALHPDIAAAEKRSRGGSSYRGASNHDGYSSGKRAGANIHTGATLGDGAATKRLGR